MSNQSKKMSAKLTIKEPVAEPVEENEPVESDNELVESENEEGSKNEDTDEEESENEDADADTDEEAEAEALKEAEAELAEMKRKAKEAETRLADDRKKRAEKKLLKLKEKAEEENNEELAPEIAKIAKLTKKLASVDEWKKELAELKAKVATGLREKQKEKGIKPPPPVFAGRGNGKVATQQSSYRLNAEECGEFFNTDIFEEEWWFIKVAGRECFLSWSEADRVYFFREEVLCGEKAGERVPTDLSASEVLKLCLDGPTNSINALVKKIFGRGANANFRTKVRNQDILNKFSIP